MEIDDRPGIQIGAYRVTYQYGHRFMTQAGTVVRPMIAESTAYSGIRLANITSHRRLSSPLC
jgi:hypothetical protein